MHSSESVYSLKLLWFRQSQSGIQKGVREWARKLSEWRPEGARKVEIFVPLVFRENDIPEREPGT